MISDDTNMTTSNIGTESKLEKKHGVIDTIIKKIDFIMDERNPVFQMYTGDLGFGSCMISNRNPIRRMVIFIVSSRVFEGVVLLVILLNCLFLGMVDPTNPKSGEGYVRNMIAFYAELLFTSFFLAESGLKIFASGLLLHKNAYLRDPWNFLDFVVVITSVIGIFSIGNFTVLRAFRAIKPLRVIFNIKEMEEIVETLKTSVKMVLCAFGIILLFSIFVSLIGVRLLGGYTQQHCFHDLTGEVFDELYFCRLNDQWLPGGNPCPDGYSCKRGPHYYYDGIIHYDNIGSGMLMTFQILTLESWSTATYFYSEAAGHWFTPFIVFIVLCGTYFFFNMLVGILNDSYRKVSQGYSSPRKIHRVLQRFIDKVNNFYESIPVPKFVKTLQKYLRKCTKHFFFKLFISLAILGNSLIMAVEHHNEPGWLSLTNKILNTIFGVIFLFEALLLIASLGPKKYFLDGSNVFDFFVMCVGLWEIISWASGLENVVFLSSALRGFRLFRILRFIAAWKSLRSIVTAILKSFKAVVMVTIVLFIFLFIMSLLSMQLFGNMYKDPGIRYDFRFLWSSFYINAQIITGEDWNYSMLKTMQKNPMTFIYYIILYMIGSQILVSLFVIILLQNVSEDGNISFQGLKAKILRNTKKIIPCFKKKHGKKNKGSAIVDMTELDQIEWDENEPKNKPGKEKTKASKKQYQKEKTKASKKQDQKELSFEPPTEDEPKKDKISMLPWKRKLFRDDVSLGIFPPSTPRRIFKILANSVVVDWFVSICIVYGSVILIFNEPFLDPNSTLHKFISISNLVVTIIFSIEVAIKILANGLFMHPTAYLRDNWNKLDFFVIVLSWLSLISPRYFDVRAFRGFRLFRVIGTITSLKILVGPLRMIKRINSMRELVELLIQSVPSVLNVIIVSFFFYSIFVIMGIQLFKGSFYRCTHQEVILEEFTTKTACLEAGYQWTTRDRNFNNFFVGIWTLYGISTLEAFAEIFFEAMNAVDHENAPRRYARPWNGVYVFFFIVVGTYFVSNLFTGVLIAKYLQMRGDTSKFSILPYDQKKWVYTQLKLFQFQRSPYPPKPKEEWRQKFYDDVTHPVFEGATIAWIFLFICVSGLHHFQESFYWQIFLVILHCFIWLGFTLELIFRYLALGTYHFKSWNGVAHVALHIVSLIEIILYATVKWVPLFNLLQILRLFHFIFHWRQVPGFRHLIKTAALTIPSFFDVFGVLLIIISVYAVLGMEILGRATRYQIWINPHVTFDNFIISCYTLFRMFTGEDWNEVALEYMKMHNSCDKRGNCVLWEGIPAIYFSSYILITFYVLANLFIANIIQSYDTLVEEMELPDLTIGQIEGFEALWEKYDPDQADAIPSIQLNNFLTELSEPLGYSSGMLPSEKMAFISELELDEHCGLIDRRKLILSLCTKKYGTFISNDILKKINHRDSLERFLRKTPTLISKHCKEPIRNFPVPSLFAFQPVNPNRRKMKFSAASLGAMSRKLILTFPHEGMKGALDYMEIENEPKQKVIQNPVNHQHVKIKVMEYDEATSSLNDTSSMAGTHLTETSTYEESTSDSESYDGTEYADTEVSESVLSPTSVPKSGAHSQNDIV